MKKILPIFAIIFLFFSCAPKQEKVEKYREDGVEVVANHLEPYVVKGEPTTFILEEEMTIDLEREDFAELGLSEIKEGEVDREGNLYLFNGSQIFKFNHEGNFVKNIGKKGQGPGEFERGSALRITDSQKLTLYDLRKKFLFFDLEGTFIQEIRDKSTIGIFGSAVYLDNGYYLFEENEFDPNEKEMGYHLTLLDKELKKIKDIDGSVTKENALQSDRYNLFDPYILHQIHRQQIYVANSQRENMEIEIYSLQGDLLKKIKKESRKVRIPEEYKKEKIDSMRKGRIWDFLKDKIYFQEYFPPFKAFFLDKEGRILVETFEKGNEPGEYVIDVFNPEGVYVGRTSLREAQGRIFKNDRMYCIREKESDYQEIEVYKIHWQLH